MGSKVAEARLAVEASPAGDKKTLALALRSLGNLERRLPQLRDDANRSYGDAAEIYRELGMPLDEAWVTRHIGINHEYAGWLAAAESAYEKALELYREHSEADDLDHANAVRYLAVIKMKLGKNDDSASLWREAVKRYEQCGVAEGVTEATRHLTQIEKPDA